ncbi:hypothetical protein [Streptomyces tailanensis]|uniref:hypothetical protein n=1 Tax=Streptomyces tailanensis TaxID=2569858 RepID=UPI001FEB9F59|nr:hypothetical protein [Streptomyces tailanensis]
MRDGASERGAGLTSFRRFTWWTVPGTTVFLLVVFFGEWILDTDVPAWARIPAAAALVVDTVASAVLLGGWLTLSAAADGSRPVWPPRTWLFAAIAATVVLAVLPLARRDYGLWAVAPAVTVAICATYLGPRRRRSLIVGAVLLAPLPGAAVSLAAGDGKLAYAALFPAGLVCWAWSCGRQRRTCSATAGPATPRSTTGSPTVAPGCG